MRWLTPAWCTAICPIILSRYLFCTTHTHIHTSTPTPPTPTHTHTHAHAHHTTGEHARSPRHVATRHGQSTRAWAPPWWWWWWWWWCAWMTGSTTTAGSSSTSFSPSSSSTTTATTSSSSTLVSNHNPSTQQQQQTTTTTTSTAAAHSLEASWQCARKRSVVMVRPCSSLPPTSSKRISKFWKSRERNSSCWNACNATAAQQQQQQTTTHNHSASNNDDGKNERPTPVRQAHGTGRHAHALAHA
jgi:hypothetical protein